MNENPYQSPVVEAKAVGVLSGRREDVMSVAKYQKGIIFCILFYFVVVFLQFVIPPELQIVPVLAILGLGLAGTVFVFLLAMKVYGTATGILLGLLTFIPCVGLIVLLIVNGKATSVLRENGIEVGFLGAKQF